MSDGINHEFDKYIDPILSDKSIWTSSVRFEEARAKLRVGLHNEGYSPDYIISVCTELMKRWEPLYQDYLDKRIIIG